MGYNLRSTKKGDRPDDPISVSSTESSAQDEPSNRDAVVNASETREQQAPAQGPPQPGRHLSFTVADGQGGFLGASIGFTESVRIGGITVTVQPGQAAPANQAPNQPQAQPSTQGGQSSTKGEGNSRST